MKNKCFIMVLVGLMLTLSNVANAGLIKTHGYLTTDITTNFITDTSTGRLYTRFDAFNLTVQDTITAVGVGGTYEGWSIVTTTQAHDFYSAALGRVSHCNATTWMDCGTILNWADGDFGNSYDTSVDWFAYIMPGNLKYGAGKIASGGTITNYPSFFTEASLNSHSATNFTSNINFLLYKDAPSNTSVPEPSTLAIFILGMIGLASRRFKKQA